MNSVSEHLRVAIKAHGTVGMYGLCTRHHSSRYSMAIRNPQRSQIGQRLSRFTLTLNNYSAPDLESFKARMAEYCTFGVIGQEVGDQGTKHLQGAGCLKKQMSFSTLKGIFPKAHLEIMRGTPQQNMEYCSKEDPVAFIHGELPAPGKRTDLNDVALAVQGGSTLVELAQSHPVMIVKYFKGLNVLRSLCSHKRTPDQPPRVYWLFGPTGTGKTRQAYDYGCATYGEDQTLILPDATLQWFDTYDGQQCVIIDDFRSKRVNFSLLLRVLDRYPLSVPIKGAYVNWIPACIIITTPYDTDRTFEQRNQHLPEDIGQLNRRLTERISFPLGNGEQLGQYLSTSVPGTGLDLERQPIGISTTPIIRPTPVRAPLVRQNATVVQCRSCTECVTQIDKKGYCDNCK